MASERRAFLSAFDGRLGPRLRALGFSGGGGHFTRARGDLFAVVEVQLSVYGERATANVGLHPLGLRAEARWRIDDDGPLHVQECAHWIRVGLLEAARRDHWWSYTSPETALEGLESALLGPGLEWIETMSQPEALLAEARQRAERSRGPRHPDGRFAELRLLAVAALAGGADEEAREALARASAVWPEEAARLSSLQDPGEDPPLPDLLGELEALLAPRLGPAPKRARPRARSSIAPSRGSSRASLPPEGRASVAPSRGSTRASLPPGEGRASLPPGEGRASVAPSRGAPRASVAPSRSEDRASIAPSGSGARPAARPSTSPSRPAGRASISPTRPATAAEPPDDEPGGRGRGKGSAR